MAFKRYHCPCTSRKSLKLSPTSSSQEVSIMPRNSSSMHRPDTKPSIKGFWAGEIQTSVVKAILESILIRSSFNLVFSELYRPRTSFCTCCRVGIVRYSLALFIILIKEGSSTVKKLWLVLMIYATKYSLNVSVRPRESPCFMEGPKECLLLFCV
jgi:hypothetical protein